MIFNNVFKNKSISLCTEFQNHILKAIIYNLKPPLLKMIRHYVIESTVESVCNQIGT